MSSDDCANRPRFASISGKYVFTSSMNESRTESLSNVFDMLRAPTHSSFKSDACRSETRIATVPGAHHLDTAPGPDYTLAGPAVDSLCADAGHSPAQAAPPDSADQAGQEKT